jgi:hypothetical protein
MPMLRELQADMLDALFERSDARAAGHVAGNGLAPESRLAIYRHNLFGNLTDALSAVYPTVAALVGDGFFRFAAHEYILAHPSRSGNLHEFGQALPEFLASFEPAGSLPYLPDCARLDWAWHAVFHTPCTPAGEAGSALARIAALSDAARLALRLRWQPAARLVASRYPIFRIWQAHQPALADAADAASRIDFDSGGEAVLVVQRAGEVTVERLVPAEHALLDALSRRAALEDAVAAALALDAAFDVAAAMAHHLGQGTLTGLDVAS